ncbi:MAG: inositol monophosphatase [Candidatus Levybacteria bacterium]|nr:inositol monophosphatase [Candidatus Levybacteria bacterium]
MTYAAFIEELLIKTSKIALENFGKVEGRIKKEDATQVLTDTDIEIGKYIVGEIEKTYPDYNIVDEEAGVVDKNSDYTWVVDPIDGTANFAVGVVTYGTMIGLLKNDIPIAGGLSLPSLDQWATAEKGKGAYFNGKKTKVTPEADLSKVLVAVGEDPKKDNPDLVRKQIKIAGEILLNSQNLRRSNSVFDEMMVARGSYGGSIFFNGKIWDNVAPHIVIEEAGGIYTDVWGKSMDYSNPLKRTRQNFTSCAAAPTLHKKLQKIIHAN